MNELIIIAGPQAAGKSTVISNLVDHYHTATALFPGQPHPVIFPLQESRQIIVHTHMLLGAIFMTADHEREVIGCDLRRLQTLVERVSHRIIYLDECNVFTLAHAHLHELADEASHFDNYLALLGQLNAKVVFLDLPPHLSWQRRAAHYRQRLVYFDPADHSQILHQYQKYLKDNYIELQNIYQRLPLPKESVNADQPEKVVTALVAESLTRLSTSFAASEAYQPA